MAKLREKTYGLKHAPVGRMTKYNVLVEGNGHTVSRFYMHDKTGRVYEYRIQRETDGKIALRAWYDITPRKTEKEESVKDIVEEIKALS